jgi:hypothetical protein
MAERWLGHRWLGRRFIRACFTVTSESFPQGSKPKGRGSTVAPFQNKIKECVFSRV